MNDNTVCCQNESATEPQRDSRCPVCSAQCYPRLPPRGGSRASGWRSLRNKRRCACFEIAIIPLSRTLPQAPSPPALDVLLAKLDRCLQHDSRREPFIYGTPRTSSPTDLAVFFKDSITHKRHRLLGGVLCYLPLGSGLFLAVKSPTRITIAVTTETSLSSNSKSLPV